ncbi:hypothetical protein CAPTEDRAFT_203490 [Capitella teleta]|uniref:Uncharacterized protein n=1 Tax=Capitella teleta TaxID=283909 RepID=R7VCW1_CAPTE|nr:hypothetical protein CAPTEDRAFT_203490 [Capitella teleta]|eukprot:ELU14136.1 hypothetical protein CAPTEDRAFT_203490 [Capitella teleta]
MYYQCVKFAELHYTEFRATAHKKSFTDLQQKKTRYGNTSWRPSATGADARTIEAEFPVAVCVTSIQSWGNPASEGYTTKYKLFYTVADGAVDAEYNSDKFDGNTDSNNGVVIALPPMWVTSFSARIINFEGYQDWRWELYGCHSHLSDGDAMQIIMKSMRSALWKMPPLLNALDLDQETANSTFFLSDDDINTCLDAPDPLSAWHSLVRIPLLPGDNPMRIIGEAIQCDFRHVLVTHQQNNASVSCGHSTRVCRLLDNGHCEAQCGDNDVDLRDVAVYVRGTPDMRLCEISSDGL